MDVKAYVQGQREQLNKQTERIKDPSVFDFNYIPDQPFVSFRQACMNRREGFGIVGCHREIVRRTTDESPNDT
jgi:hypothetical protein